MRPDALGRAPAYVAQRQGGYPRVKLINEQIQRGWVDYGLKPSARATDDEWCRRLFLDVIGRIPTVEELREFRSSRDPNKKRELIDRLLEDERYSNEYARNWTTIWTNNWQPPRVPIRAILRSLHSSDI